MSRQSKNATRLAAARHRSAERKAGRKGPAQTTPKHGKSSARRMYSMTCRGNQRVGAWS